MSSSRKILGVHPLRSLRGRMALSMAGVVMLILVVGVGMDRVRGYRVHWAETVNSLNEQAYAIQLARSRTQDEDAFAEYVHEICAMMNTRISPGHHILILRPNGQILASTRHHSGGEVEQALLTAGADQPKILVNGREMAQVRVQDADGSIIIVAQYLDYMKAILNERLIREAISTGLTAAATAMLVFLMLGKWVLTPLSRLRTAVRAWSHNRLSVRSDVGGPDDIRGLALELNDMAARLERYEAERAELEQQRRRLDERAHHTRRLESLGVLAGGVAHDFNNLLTTVLGNADLALLDVPEGSPAKESLLELKRASKRAAELSGKMLAYSGKGRFITETIGLNDVLSVMLGEIRSTTPPETRIKFEPTSNLPSIEADTAQLQQLVENLVTNSAEAFDEGHGTVLIRTGIRAVDSRGLADVYLGDELQEGTYVYLQVADTGSGMDPDTKAKAFEPFYSTKFPGRGLGLAVVLGITRGHQGAILLESDPGQGTVFTVLFPVSRVDEPVAAGVPHPGEARTF